jgi:hypothetical protein
MSGCTSKHSHGRHERRRSLRSCGFTVSSADDARCQQMIADGALAAWRLATTMP